MKYLFALFALLVSTAHAAQPASICPLTEERGLNYVPTVSKIEAGPVGGNLEPRRFMRGTFSYWQITYLDRDMYQRLADLHRSTVIRRFPNGVASEIAYPATLEQRVTLDPRGVQPYANGVRGIVVSNMPGTYVADTVGKMGEFTAIGIGTHQAHRLAPERDYTWYVELSYVADAVNRTAPSSNAVSVSWIRGVRRPDNDYQCTDGRCVSECLGTNYIETLSLDAGVFLPVSKCIIMTHAFFHTMLQPMIRTDQNQGNPVKKATTQDRLMVAGPYPVGLVDDLSKPSFDFCL